MRAALFCTGWKFQKGDCDRAPEPDFDDNGWESILLPHTYNDEDMQPGMLHESAYEGPAWYRKHFALPEHIEPDARYFLLFEAVANQSRIFVNGCYVGGRNGGFLANRVDITPALEGRSGGHVVAVRADNSFVPGMVPPEVQDWERYGGIYRKVWLQVKGGAHFDFKSIRIETSEVSGESAQIQIRSQIREATVRSRNVRVVHRITGPSGNTVLSLESSVKTKRGCLIESVTDPCIFRTPLLWSPDSPNLYKVQSELLDGDRLLDREENPLGFRSIRFDPDHGFFLNGQPLKLKGICAHQDMIGLGNALPDHLLVQDIEIIKAAGMNFLRMAHYPHAESQLDACDRLGVMVMEEQPFWHGSLRAEYGEVLVENARRLMRDMVTQHFNHPSIIIWNTVNEVMLKLIKGEAHPDPAAKNPAYHLPPDEYPYACRVIEAMTETLHVCDPSRPACVVVGRSWDKNELAGTTRLTDLVAYNGGAVHDVQDGRTPYDRMHEKDPERCSLMSEGLLIIQRTLRADWEKEEKQWQPLAQHWSRFYEREWFAGGSMWAFCDFSAKGVNRYPGMVDAWRQPKESFYFFRAMWHSELTAHILGHWDWPGMEGRMRSVVVFTNGESGELLLNGRSHGVAFPDMTTYPGLPHPPLEWQVPYEPGEMKVIVRRGDETAEDVRITSGLPDRLIVEACPRPLSCEVSDAAIIQLRVVDKNGQRCYQYSSDFQAQVEGVGKTASLNISKITGGLGAFPVKTVGVPGNITVEVAAPGLSPAGLILNPIYRISTSLRERVSVPARPRRR